MVVALSPTEFPPGAPLDRYRVVGVIGRGGMGTIYEVVDPKTHPPARRAVKVLHADRARDPRSVARFEREIRLLAELSHPTIVDLEDVGRLPDGRCYAVMELLTGESLEQRLRREGPQAPELVVAWLGDVAAALDAAHALDVVHRDVKPSNIQLPAAPGQRVKLLDFGIARLLALDAPPALETRTDELLGSPQYMSPEQCRGRPVDRRSDVYSLGLVAYEALTGERAMQAATFGDLLLRQQTEQLALPAQWPAALRDCLARATAKDPAQRQPSATRFVHQLAAALEQEPADAPLAGPTAPCLAELPEGTRTVAPSGRGRRSHGLLLAAGLLLPLAAAAAILLASARDNGHGPSATAVAADADLALAAGASPADAGQAGEAAARPAPTTDARTIAVRPGRQPRRRKRPRRHRRKRMPRKKALGHDMPLRF